MWVSDLNDSIGDSLALIADFFFRKVPAPSLKKAGIKLGTVLASEQHKKRQGNCSLKLEKLYFAIQG